MTHKPSCRNAPSPIQYAQPSPERPGIPSLAASYALLKGVHSPLVVAQDLDLGKGRGRFSCSPGYTHYVAEDSLELSVSPASISLELQVCAIVPDLLGEPNPELLARWISALPTELHPASCLFFSFPLGCTSSQLQRASSNIPLSYKFS